MNQSINLNLIPDGVKPVAKVSQYDIGRVVTFSLYQGAEVYTPPSGTTVEFREMKADRKICIYNNVATLSGSTITLTTNMQMCAAAGEALCQFKLSKSGTELATLNFLLDVQVDPAAEGDTSESVLPDIIAMATEQMVRAEAAALSAEEDASDSEAYAKGTRGGNPVGSSDPAYHNNSKYYAEDAADSASSAGQSASSASDSAEAAAAWSANPPYIGANGNWYVYDTTQHAYKDSGVDASITITIEDVNMLAASRLPYVTNTGTNTDPHFHFFLPRSPGNVTVTKTGTSGLVDSYRMTFENGYYFDYTVTNGEDGAAHIIQDAAGQDLTNRPTLQFTNAEVEDDSANNKTTVTIPVFVGATSSSDGSSGMPTKPLAGDEKKFFCGDGTWKNVDFSPLFGYVYNSALQAVVNYMGSHYGKDTIYINNATFSNGTITLEQGITN